MRDGCREAGKISYVKDEPEYHDIPTVSVGIDFGSSFQSFGGLALDAGSLKWFLDELCEIFDVQRKEQLIGKKCYALRNFGIWNDAIEGIEAPSGKRFTITGFRKRHYPEFAKSPLEHKREELESTIRWATRRAEEAKEQLKTVASGFVDWEQS